MGDVYCLETDGTAVRCVAIPARNDIQPESIRRVLYLWELLPSLVYYGE